MKHKHQQQQRRETLNLISVETDGIDVSAGSQGLYGTDPRRGRAKADHVFRKTRHSAAAYQVIRG